MEASQQTREVYRRVFYGNLDSNEIPHQWQNGEIIRIYKRKGAKGKCSNERDVTLASNVGNVLKDSSITNSMKETI